MFWKREIETLHRGGLRDLQAKKMARLAGRVAVSPFYRRFFESHGITGMGGLRYRF